MEPEGTSISVRACRDFNQCGGVSSGRESRQLAEFAGTPEKKKQKKIHNKRH